MAHLIIGGARSGKSSYAQAATLANGQPVTLIVTATPCDDEMRARIAQHQAERPVDWTVIEAADDLPTALATHAKPGHAVLVDCLTLWLSKTLCERPDNLAAECAALVTSVAEINKLGIALCLVSNEVGWGIVPMHPVTRIFADEQGRLNQRVAAVCDEVHLVVAGRVLRL